MALHLTGLEARYANGTVGLRPTTLHVLAGERLVLLGPSGAGKSTLLRLIAGLETPSAGTITWDGITLNGIPPHERPVAFVPQRPALYPHLSVQENLERSLRASKQAKPLSDAVEMLKIGHLLKRLPHELSGGEKQRVALARAVLRNAPLWLLDEPFSPLDPAFRAEFRREMLLLLESLRATIILVSHDPNDALALGRLVGVLGNGAMQQLGTAEELIRQPGNRFVAAALGQFFLITGSAHSGNFVLSDGARYCASPAGAEGPLTLAVSLHGPGGTIPAMWPDPQSLTPAARRGIWFGPDGERYPKCP